MRYLPQITTAIGLIVVMAGTWFTLNAMFPLPIPGISSSVALIDTTPIPAATATQLPQPTFTAAPTAANEPTNTPTPTSMPTPTTELTATQENALIKSIPNTSDDANIRIDPKINEETINLEYEIVYEVKDIRYDGGISYYVLVDKVDLSTPDFKNDIKKAIDEIVRLKGEKISIDFVNDRDILDLLYKYNTLMLNRLLTDEEMDKRGDSLVAAFSGQLETDIYFNTLYFFPGTFTDNPRVGKYVDVLEYNPQE